MEKIHAKEDTPSAKTVSTMSFMQSLMKSRYSEGLAMIVLVIFVGAVAAVLEEEKKNEHEC